MTASTMRYFKTLFLVMISVALTACMSTKSFLDPSFPKISYEELKKPLQPKKLKVTAEFQRNGEHLEKVDQAISDSTERILRASGLAIPGSEGTDGTIHVVLNNIADVGGAVGKGLGTGLTFGLAGSLVTDAYEMQVTITVGGKTFTRTAVKHALHSAIGRAETPEGIETMPVQTAFERLFEQMLLRVLKEYQSSPEFSSLGVNRSIG
ncbi:MAG: hypothetical protein CVU36_22555 [Betaproteobacteria bacterium HGW-Betaproteobacteria-9]|jgi:hypothetical protein|nr:MAG: hypothetical protein CVU36_22555 [Betaproteobacteria bacterium HGW-Betaproteobacteria-9]